MRHLLPLLPLLVASPLAAQTAPAPNPTLSADRLAMMSCLRDAPASREGCIGSVAVACVRSSQSGDRVAAEIGCARREEAVWRERLALAGEGALRNADAGRRSRFVALQLAWEGYVQQKCSYYAAGQPAARSPGLRAGCEVREVALRALELERGLPQAGGRRPSAPPQIIR